MKIDVSVILLTVLNVLILYWFLRKKLFIPVTSFMNNRTHSIEKQLKEAEEKFNKAQSIYSEYEKKLNGHEEEGKKIIQEYKEKAIKLSNEILEDARTEAELIKTRAVNDAEREKEKAKDEIRRQIIELAIMAAAKAVEGQFDNKTQHLLIKQFISKVGDQHGS